MKRRDFLKNSVLMPIVGVMAGTVKSEPKPPSKEWMKSLFIPHKTHKMDWLLYENELKSNIGIRINTCSRCNLLSTNPLMQKKCKAKADSEVKHV